GALTAELLAAGAQVIAIELDERMIAALRDELAEPIAEGRLEVLAGDARELDLAAIAGARGRRLKLAGNLPYYASSPLVRRAVAARGSVSDATFTLQREVARRIAAAPGSKEYGGLSAIVQLWAEASVPLKLPAGAFHPRPGVESAVLRRG